MPALIFGLYNSEHRCYLFVEFGISGQKLGVVIQKNKKAVTFKDVEERGKVLKNDHQGEKS